MRRVDPKYYDEKYYLTDCTGYREFKKSFGKILEPRLSRIVKEIPNLKNLSVLDIGCGRGELVFWAAENGAKRAIGVDYSKAAIKLANKAKKHYSPSVQSKVKFMVRDAKKLSFPKGSFDVIFLVEVLEHLYPEEQIIVFEKIKKILKGDGRVIVHTSPNKIFNDLTYRFWCYPLSTVLVKLNNLLTGNSYPNLSPPSEIRSSSHKIMHVSESTYFSLKKLFSRNGFCGKIFSTNVTVNKPVLSWKDLLFNFIVYLYPLSKYFPFNVFWGNDFIVILEKR